MMRKTGATVLCTKAGDMQLGRSKKLSGRRTASGVWSRRSPGCTGLSGVSDSSAVRYHTEHVAVRLCGTTLNTLMQHLLAAFHEETNRRARAANLPNVEAGKFAQHRTGKHGGQDQGGSQLHGLKNIAAASHPCAISYLRWMRQRPHD